jgi:hypothetical protein
MSQSRSRSRCNYEANAQIFFKLAFIEAYILVDDRRQVLVPMPSIPCMTFNTPEPATRWQFCPIPVIEKLSAMPH